VPGAAEQKEIWPPAEREGMIMMRKIIAALTGILAVPGLSLWLALPASAAPAAVPGIHAATSCGIWRWPVKTGSDADRRKVNQTVVDTTISYLRARTAPSSFAGFQDRRFRGAERHTYRLRARLTQFRLEDDGDIHLVLQNSSGKDMIAEIPRPGCVARSSLWRSAIRAVRSRFTDHYPVSTSWHHLNRRISIVGIGFFDEIHNVTGQAPNGIELHPVTGIRFR
jgi:hypothetical protein